MLRCEGKAPKEFIKSSGCFIIKPLPALQRARRRRAVGKLSFGFVLIIKLHCDDCLLLCKIRDRLKIEKVYLIIIKDDCYWVYPF